VFPRPVESVRLGHWRTECATGGRAGAVPPARSTPPSSGADAMCRSRTRWRDERKGGRMPCSCGRALLPGETQCERCRRREYERRRQRARHQYETRICEECGAPYETTKTSNRHTCGALKCQRARAVRLDRAARAQRRPQIVLTCPICGRRVPRKSSRQKTCLAPECAAAWSRLAQKRAGRRATSRRPATPGPGLAGRGPWGLDVGPWASETLDAGLLPREVISYLSAEMLPLL